MTIKELYEEIQRRAKQERRASKDIYGSAGERAHGRAAAYSDVLNLLKNNFANDILKNEEGKE